MPILNPEALEVKLQRKPKAFGFTDLTTGRSYEVANTGYPIRIVHDSSLRFTSYPPINNFERGLHNLVITGPYDPLFMLHYNDGEDTPLDVAWLETLTGTLHPHSSSPKLVVKRDLDGGRSLIMQESRHGGFFYSNVPGREYGIDAYLLDGHERREGDKTLIDVIDLANPLLGLEASLKDCLLLANKDILLPHVSFKVYSDTGTLYKRGKDPFTELNVLAAIQPMEVDLLQAMGLKLPVVPLLAEETNRLQAELMEKVGAALEWTDEFLRRESCQSRLWEELEGNESKYLWYKSTSITAGRLKGDIGEAIEKKKFDEHGNYTGPKLQVTYLY